ncbi:hypothetical protein SH1V18_46180 [Vallitalea longa]|uniref:DUF4358 domain-containing protein n=1 Tax=Vallitalea longa TaxID=2936439 RepID=A0A9W5YH12_9FIRM|nr:DUF4358 domain-containing protein [Vallitalea longa]GKX32138.1 hypothetical protein SH1V18_46180 [Vallitalea longa]
MKRILAIITIMMAMSVMFVGCSKDNEDKDNNTNVENPDSGNKDDNEDKDGNQEIEKDVKVEDIAESIKDQIVKDMVEKGLNEEDITDETPLPGYIYSDLKQGEEDALVTLEIDKDKIEEGRMIVPMINLNSDQIIILKAVDDEAVTDLKEFLEKTKEDQIGVWEQYLPDQYEKVKNNIIKTSGKYLLYVTYDNPEIIEEIFDNMIK